MESFRDKTDEEIIELYKNGQNEAFKELIDRYTPILFNFVARIGGRGAAPDILQEIFIKVWRNLTNFNESKASFKTWIFTISKNATTDYLRKKKSVLFSDLENHNEDKDEESFAENIVDDTILPDEAMAKLEDIELLNNTLEKLRPSYKEILVLHYQEEMTFDEIGKVLNKPLNTVKSQHRRALIELRNNL